MNKNNNINYLDLIPIRTEHIKWNINDKKEVTLEINNTGFFHKITQRLFKKPKVSYIHLDEFGSFIWLLIDGNQSVEVLS